MTHSPNCPIGQDLDQRSGILPVFPRQWALAPTSCKAGENKDPFAPASLTGSSRLGTDCLQRWSRTGKIGRLRF
jgi:hypothetical protein